MRDRQGQRADRPPAVPQRASRVSRMRRRTSDPGSRRRRWRPGVAGHRRFCAAADHHRLEPDRAGCRWARARETQRAESAPLERHDELGLLAQLHGLRPSHGTAIAGPMLGAPENRSPDVVAVVLAVSPGSALIRTRRSALPFTVAVCGAPGAVPVPPPTFATRRTHYDAMIGSRCRRCRFAEG
jgi:hypothetical protein